MNVWIRNESFCLGHLRAFGLLLRHLEIFLFIYMLCKVILFVANILCPYCFNPQWPCSLVRMVRCSWWKMPQKKCHHKSVMKLQSLFRSFFANDNEKTHHYLFFPGDNLSVAYIDDVHPDDWYVFMFTAFAFHFFANPRFLGRELPEERWVGRSEVVQTMVGCCRQEFILDDFL